MNTRWIEQPKGSLLCGQIAVAVVSGERLEAVVAEFGHERATGTRELVKVLRRMRYEVPDRLIRRKQSAILARPGTCIARLKVRGKRIGHWVALAGGKVYDGAFGDPSGRYEWPEDAMLTSYLPIREGTR